jgi:hypothetical protein
MFIGQGRAGKTGFLRNLTNQGFQADEGITDGADVCIVSNTMWGEMKEMASRNFDKAVAEMVGGKVAEEADVGQRSWYLRWYMLVAWSTPSFVAQLYILLVGTLRRHRPRSSAPPRHLRRTSQPVRAVQLLAMYYAAFAFRRSGRLQRRRRSLLLPRRQHRQPSVRQTINMLAKQQMHAREEKPLRWLKVFDELQKVLDGDVNYTPHWVLRKAPLN